MLDKKNRTDILNNSYNRYSVDLSERRHLPAWFKQEEEAHMQASCPSRRLRWTSTSSD